MKTWARQGARQGKEKSKSEGKTRLDKGKFDSLAKPRLDKMLQPEKDEAGRGEI